MADFAPVDQEMATSPVALLAAARAGNKAAEDRLLSWVYTYIRDRVSRQAGRLPDPAVASSDLTQNVVWNVWKSLDKFKGATPGEFWKYVNITTNHVVGDEYRRAHAELRDADRRKSLPDGSAFSPPAGNDSPSQEAVKKEEEQQREAALEAALGALSELQREVFRKRFQEHREYRDIAAELEITEAYARQIFSRACKDLKKMLESVRKK